MVRVGDALVFADGEVRTVAEVYDVSGDAQRTATTATRMHCDHRWHVRAKVTGVDEAACAHCGVSHVVQRVVFR